MTEAWLAAFDPGETTGYAVFDREGKNLDMDSCVGREALYSVLADIGPVAKVIIEDYRLYQHKAMQQSGSRLETVRVIGAIESWAHQNKSQIVLQPASIKRIAELWSGAKPKGAHKHSHFVDAFNHGYYYLQKNGIIQPVRRG